MMPIIHCQPAGVTRTNIVCYYSSTSSQELQQNYIQLSIRAMILLHPRFILFYCGLHALPGMHA